MENEIVKIELSVAHWNSILSVISLAPFQAVNQISDAVNQLQTQAGPQMAELAAKYAPAEEAAAE